ncbi:MAG: DUF5117 domain-containing protein [Cryomorphaceae bacterium]|jgi:hypothetical protein|nr:DUF5117 domain-containing protein [Cryomorphaceae bacterium]MBT5417278.1 DUF5117 domain-containing protein [Cryomorphaceae bacterium]MBT6224066.1 DUF5117 domain-containing protein [Cryomorphaceae bacterium]MBT6730174.1 DUF5117 domain-containing protein [Cryomorphaceae bacterium]MBT7683771.1 DUF5117 domain-containing protein [Cryomorphaceae bacterium]
MKKIIYSLLIFMISSNIIFAQDKTEEKEKEDKTKKEKTFEEVTKQSKLIEGLFDIYQDSISGKIQMLIKEEQLSKDFIYGSQIADGIVQAGGFRGLYNDEKIINFKKFFDKIEISFINTNFYFDKNNPLYKSREANISNAIISSSKIDFHDKENGTYLINANDLFLSESLTRVKPPSRPNQSRTAFSLGSLDKAKSKIMDIRNYPENLNIKTDYVYNNPNILSSGSNSISDSRYVSMKAFHTLIEMPDEDYEIRLDDQRVGYFLTQVDNLTDSGTTNYRDLVNRWKLIKKDPSLDISEPIKPITWWIENSTPMEWRQTIKEAVLQWNVAFEKAGFKNAVEVKIQPDDADWDAGDIRYNVLRWTSSPNPPFGGYGPSMVNPKTGEIIAADVMLEFVFFTNRVFYDKLYSNPSSVMNTDNYNQTHDHNNFVCSAGSILHDNINFGRTFIALNGDDYDLEELERQSMMYLIMHEVGHTLGLNHNMKSSSIFTPLELYDNNKLKGKAISGSVMDYPALNLNPNPKIKSPYADSSVGHYDKWAIEFGYKPFNSEEERNEILSRSTDPLLIFGNDADILYSSRGIDPRVQTNDMSSDPISYSIDRMELVNDLFDDILDKFQKPGDTYEDLRRAFFNLNSQYAGAASTISKFIGGVYVERSVIGQKGSQKPYTAVSYKDQKRAFKALDKHIFSSDNYKIPSEIFNYLARQRRGFDFFSGSEDPKIHDIILSNQSRILSQLMAPNTLQRLKDSELYGNKYKLSEFMSDINKSIFSDIAGNVDSFRQNLQIIYTNRLVDIISNDKGKSYKNHAKSLALLNLNDIMGSINSKGNRSSLAHKMHLKSIIEKALDND